VRASEEFRNHGLFVMSCAIFGGCAKKMMNLEVDEYARIELSIRITPPHSINIRIIYYLSLIYYPGSITLTGVRA